LKNRHNNFKFSLVQKKTANINFVDYAKSNGMRSTEKSVVRNLFAEMAGPDFCEFIEEIFEKYFKISVKND
jgi:hypothetical protein